MNKYCIFLLLLPLLLIPANTHAKVDLSIAETDITFSKEAPLEGETIRVYAKVFNSGDVDVSGFVVFYDEDKAISDPQPISIRPGSYDDVFADWQAKQGEHNIKASLVSLNPKDGVAENDSTTRKGFIVDIDTDKDGISDLKDIDADNDGLSNEEEQKIGTNSLIADTDGDGVNDKIDAFPKDKTETVDTDNDGLGDNKDLDDDGDGILDNEEIYTYGTNPQNPDTDGDSISDKKEIDQGTDPKKADSDNDGVKDPDDKFPLDSSKWQASLFGSALDFFKGDNKYLAIGLGIFSLIILFFMFRRKKRR